jgi:regulator of sirC expression with transglutaminase-like and TPR domain
VPAKGEARLLDVYEGGQALSREQADEKVKNITGRSLRDEHLAAVKKSAIIVRMLHNLLNLAQSEKDKDGMLRYLNAIVTVAPESAEERGLRAALLYQMGDRPGALQDVDWLLEHNPEGLDIQRVRQFRRLLTQPE